MQPVKQHNLRLALLLSFSSNIAGFAASLSTDSSASVCRHAVPLINTALPVLFSRVCTVEPHSLSRSRGENASISWTCPTTVEQVAEFPNPTKSIILPIVCFPPTELMSPEFSADTSLGISTRTSYSSMIGDKMWPLIPNCDLR
ncbi:hypothetical protein BLNAU_16490 [Blattamonas nauphoetae]|uniref:Secreted protein n=1 Tax=Blattamonas nauphoetae TaxID=2049346 RepID=A0ABQ9X897_9EUKA|nr:hypothetical protein BLNAU_16490 [Blattamonas nauphoetae]